MLDWSYCINYKFTRNKQQIILKIESTQNVLIQWKSPLLGYSLILSNPLISLQPGMFMAQPGLESNQAL